MIIHNISLYWDILPINIKIIYWNCNLRENYRENWIILMIEQNYLFKVYELIINSLNDKDKILSIYQHKLLKDLH